MEHTATCVKYTAMCVSVCRGLNEMYHEHIRYVCVDDIQGILTDRMLLSMASLECPFVEWHRHWQDP